MLTACDGPQGKIKISRVTPSTITKMAKPENAVSHQAMMRARRSGNVTTLGKGDQLFFTLFYIAGASATPPVSGWKVEGD